MLYWVITGKQVMQLPRENNNILRDIGWYFTLCFQDTAMYITMFTKIYVYDTRTKNEHRPIV